VRKIKYILLLGIVIFIVSCSSDSCDLGTTNGLEGEVDLHEEDIKSNMKQKESNENIVEIVAQKPLFNNSTGNHLESPSFRFLTTSNSGELFVATEFGFGRGLYYLDYPLGNLTLQPILFKEPFPYAIRGFFELNGEFFVLGGTMGMIRENSGAIGRLVSNEVAVLYYDGRILYVKREWHGEKYLALPGSPRVFLLDGENLYIVTDSQILLVKNNEVTILINDIIFNNVRNVASPPKAVDKIDDTIFIKTDNGIWSYDVQSGEIEFNEND